MTKGIERRAKRATNVNAHVSAFVFLGTQATLKVESIAFGRQYHTQGDIPKGRYHNTF